MFGNLQISTTEGSEEPSNQTQMKQAPATERADLTKKKTFDLQPNELEHLKTATSVLTPSSKSSSFLKEQFNNDYLTNRDPMKEFFALVIP